jgi:hypothetical protein
MDYVWVEKICFLGRECIAKVTSDYEVQWEIRFRAPEQTPNFRNFGDVREWVETTDAHRRLSKQWNRKRSEYVSANLSETDRRNRVLQEPGSLGPSIATGLGAMDTYGAKPVNRQTTHGTTGIRRK